MKTIKSSPSNRIVWWLRLLMAASGAWAVQFAYHLVPADRDAGVVDVLVTAGLYLLFTLYGRTSVERGIRRRAGLTAAAFVLVLAGCDGWLSSLRYEHFSDPFFYTAYYINAFVGLFLLFYAAIALLLTRAAAAPFCGPIPADGVRRARKVFFVSFCVCALIYLLFLFNQYPGSMESDHMRQLKSMLESRFDNRNPLVNSLLVLGCVRLAQAFGGSMNVGVFCYGVVQLLLLAAVFAFGVSRTARAGFPKWVTVSALLFYALVPYNIFYSYGMWKDSFFAAWLLLTVFLLWNVLIKRKAGERVTAFDWAALGVSALLASLSRNSGWSALLLTLPFLLLWKDRALRRGAALALGGGVALSLLLMGPVYSALGVDKTADSITVSCIPLQQIGAVIANGKELSPEQERLLADVVALSDVKEQYDPACADPMKDLLYPRIATLNANLGAYAKLWVQLGVRYPMTYLRAYLAQVRMYIDPNASSETAYKWIYQNDFGVYRDPKLLPGVDFGYYESLLELPVLNLLKRPGAVLWSIVLLLQLCVLRKNGRMSLLYLPLLAVFFGLFLTVPVALMRYVYSVMACMPFLFLWPFWRMDAD